MDHTGEDKNKLIKKQREGRKGDRQTDEKGNTGAMTQEKRKKSESGRGKERRDTKR